MTAPIQLKTAEQIRDDILTEISTNTGIADQNLGSVTRTKAFAYASELDEYYFQLYKLNRAFYIKTATGDSLASRGSDFGLTRLPAVAAVGIARFTCSGDATIPNGTQISAPATTARDKILFETPSTGTYSRVGAGTIDVPITAVVAGSAGNLGASTITQLESSITNVTSVTNPSSTTLGAEEEDDDSFRERILRHIEGLSRCTIPSILNGAIDWQQQSLTLARAMDASQVYIEVEEDLTQVPISIASTGKLGINGNTEVVTYTGINTSVDPHQITGVTRAQEGTTAVAHEVGKAVTEYIPTGEGTSVTSATVVESSCHVDVYVDDGTASGPHSELVSLVQKRLRGDGTERDPGYKAGGITLTVTAVAPVTITITASLQYTAGYSASSVQTAVQTALDAWINAFKAGTDVLGYAVACTILDVDGVETITTLTVNGTAFTGAGTADVTISDTQVARSASAGSHTIT